jgi:hypothetical protein
VGTLYYCKKDGHNIGRGLPSITFSDEVERWNSQNSTSKGREKMALCLGS